MTGGKIGRLLGPPARDRVERAGPALAQRSRYALLGDVAAPDQAPADCPRRDDLSPCGPYLATGLREGARGCLLERSSYQTRATTAVAVGPFGERSKSPRRSAVAKPAYRSMSS